MARRELNGAAVREMRDALGITQHELARRVSITQGALSNIERGKHGAQPALMRRLADVMGVALDSITYPVPDAEPEPASAQ